MGHALTIDTLAYAKRLIAVGMPAKQAEEQVEIFAEVLDNNIATKQNIEEIRRDMKELEMKLTIRLGMMMAGSIAAVATLVELL